MLRTISETGDPVGQGKVSLVTPVDATFSGNSSDSNGVFISVTLPNFNPNWSLTFRTPGSVRRPGVGTYESARRTGQFNVLSVSGPGSCSTSTGRFVVLEAQYGADGSLVRFAADFEQHCENTIAGLFGAIRFNSTITDSVPFGGAFPLYKFTVTPPAHGTIVGSGINCGPSTAVCEVNSAAATTVSVQAIPDAGYVFAGWIGDCGATPRAAVLVNMQRQCSATFIPVVPLAPRTVAVVTGTSQSMAMTDALVPWSISSLFPNGIRLFAVAQGLTRDTELTVWLNPPTGQTFQPGATYASLSNADATHAEVSVSTNTSSCFGSGTLTVREWNGTTGVAPTRFAVDFEVQCSSTAYAGVILYNSDFQYGVLAADRDAMTFQAVLDSRGVVSHSADQPFNVTGSGPLPLTWSVKSDQQWLTASPATAPAPAAATARVRNSSSSSSFNFSTTGKLQILARGIINLPDPITVTLDVVPLDTTARPNAVFRASSGTWFAPGQPAQFFGATGDIPISGDFNGDLRLDTAVYRPSTAEWFIAGQPSVRWGRAGDIPVPGDYNGDTITDVAVFRTTQEGSALWYIRGESAPRVFGNRGDIPVPADFDGDGIVDLAVFRPSTATWRILKSFSGLTTTTVLGSVGDVPVPADFDGDRIADLAIYRPSTGVWNILWSASGSTFTRTLGLPGDIPVPMDVTGDGMAELRVWRPATGTWLAFDRLTFGTTTQQFGQAGDVPVMQRPFVPEERPVDMDGDLRADLTVYRPATGQWFTALSSAGLTTFSFVQWGSPGDVPVPGDYDGDRRGDAAVFRPSTGQWFLRLSSTGQPIARLWGASSDRPFAADYDGDGATDIAVYRPEDGSWFVLTAASNFQAVLNLPRWGASGDLPIPRDYDGDGAADLAVYRPSTGEWFVRPSSPTSGGFIHIEWGAPGDVPVPQDFDGDGTADQAVYRPSTGEWFVRPSSPIEGGFLIFRWGAPGDQPAAADYDGDGVTDPAVYRASTGEWFARKSSDGGLVYRQWGGAGDVPMVRR